MKAAYLLLIPALFLSNSASAQSDLQTLAERMTGSFSSAAQAAEDDSYFDIRLEMVPIWTEREDGPWLYVEQAAASALDKPYRQRVYQLLETEDGVIESRVFSIPEPLRFAGAWKSDDPLTEIDPSALEIRKGCGVFLRADDSGDWSGSTDAKKCESVLRGASYATSEVVVQEDRILSWDQGFNSADEQVWGAVEGGYVFLRSDK